MLSIILTLGLAGCENDQSGEPPQSAAEQSAQTAAPATQTAAAAPSAAQEPAYEFAFEDVDGNVHKLSDYKGAPVYLEVWGTWCSVCMSSLPDLNKFAGEKNDFTVLSVVFPDTAGELSKEDFIKWYKDTEYKNLIVLLDENQQILRDFGISAFPSIIVFDGSGAVVTGFAGLLPQETIREIMKQVGAGTYEG